jgi:hypothetical protein
VFDPQPAVFATWIRAPKLAGKTIETPISGEEEGSSLMPSQKARLEMVIAAVGAAVTLSGAYWGLYLLTASDQ